MNLKNMLSEKALQKRTHTLRFHVRKSPVQAKLIMTE